MCALVIGVMLFVAGYWLLAAVAIRRSVVRGEKRDAMKIHPSIDADRLLAAVKAQTVDLVNPGFCIVCGADAEGVEPDARKYPCESCGNDTVYGAEEILLLIGALGRCFLDCRRRVVDHEAEVGPLVSVTLIRRDQILKHRALNLGRELAVM